MYFLRRLRPIEVAGERVRELRVSLNAPVLSTPDLPIGPASGVIVVHQETRGRMDATVGVRSLRSGETVYWSFDGDLISQDDLSVAGDAALTFAESLGFLFDERGLGPGADAQKAWTAWLHGAAPLVTEALGEEESPAELPELLLEELVVEADDTGSGSAEAAASVSAPAAVPAPAIEPEAAPEPAPARKARLSKFRARSPDGPDKRPERAAAQQARARSPEEERRLLLRKLLTSF